MNERGPFFWRLDADESRLWTVCLACFSVGSILFFIAVFAPALLSRIPDGAGIRPMNFMTLAAAALGSGGWTMPILLGIRQVFTKPRKYGGMSMGIGILHLVAFRLIEWLLMTNRGIHWGT